MLSDVSHYWHVNSENKQEDLQTWNNSTPKRYLRWSTVHKITTKKHFASCYYTNSKLVNMLQVIWYNIDICFTDELWTSLKSVWIVDWWIYRCFFILNDYNEVWLFTCCYKYESSFHSPVGTLWIAVELTWWNVFLHPSLWFLHGL